MISLKSITVVVFLLCFFPQFNVLPFLDADYQPIASIIIIIYYFILKRSFHLSYSELWIILLFFLMLPWLVFGFTKNPVQSVVTYFLYMVGPLIFVYIKQHFHLIDDGIVKKLVYLFLVISIIQAAMPDSLQNVLNPYFQMIVNRGQLGTYPGGRGVGVLYAEPAHAARFIWLLFFFVFLFNLKRKYIMALLVCAYLNKSGTMFGLLALTVFVFFFVEVLLRFNRKVFTSLFLIILISVVGYISLPESSLLRFDEKLSALNNIVENVSDFDAWERFANIRFLTTFSGYYSAIINVWGSGIGLGQYDIMPTMELMGIDLNNVWFIRTYSPEYLKGSSYISQIFSDIGVFATVVLLALCSHTIWMFKKVGSNVVRAFLVVNLFQLLFFSTTTLPVMWLLLGCVHGMISGMSARRVI